MKKLFASSLAPISLLALCFQGCSGQVAPLEDGGFDSGVVDDGGPDSGFIQDSGTTDDGGPDSGVLPDAGPDSGVVPDAGPDSGVVPDAGPDAGTDGGVGGPYFGTPMISAVSTGVAELATGDFNGDGKTDLVVSLGDHNVTGTAADVLIGNGNGTFQSPIALMTGGPPREVAVLDIDGDGNLDVAVGVCATGSNRVSYFLNQGGDAGFGARHDVSVTLCPYSLTVAAGLSGNGAAGLATAGPGPYLLDQGSGEVNLLVAIDGGLEVATTFTTPNPATGIVAADLNQDGLTDIVATTSLPLADQSVQGAVMVWTAVSGGGWQSPTTTSVDHGGYRSMAAGDLDGNGTVDVVMVSSDTSTLAVLPGSGTGTFGTPSYIGVADAPVDVALTDFRGTGALDIAVATTGFGPFVGLSVFPGGGGASDPLAAEMRVLTDGPAYGIAVADFNGDGKMDVAVSLRNLGASGMVGNSGQVVSVIPGLAHTPFLPDPGTFVPAAHEPIPPVAYHGGPVLSSPQIITITFKNETPANTLLYQQFDEWIVGSDWFSQIGADYGVSAGTNVNVPLDQDAASLYSDLNIQNLLYGLILDGGLPPPVIASGDNVPEQLYFLYFPYGTTISDNSIGVSCQSFGAYHNENTVGPTSFAYAVIPNCIPSNPYYTEVSASHELAEASSDPLVQTGLAYSNTSFNNGWIGEIGDVCTNYNAGYSLDGGTFYVVQRIWSNSAADAGTQPCIPAPNIPYAGAAPEALTTQSVQLICDGNSPETCTSVYYVTAGDRFTLTVDGWTSQPAVAFSMVTVPYSVAGLVPATFSPTVDSDAFNLHNGDQAHLTVNIPSNAPSNSIGMFTILTGYDNDDYAYWPVMVYVQ